VRNQLDQKAIQQNFLGTPLFTRLSPQDQRRCYQILSGTEPPPKMAFTPPPPSSRQHSASTSDLTTRSHISSPKPKSSSDAQKPPELLSPPLLSKPNTLHPQSSESMTRRLERPVSSDAQIRSTPKSEAARRDSRSRYRPISAPNVLEISPVDARTRAPGPFHAQQSSQSANAALSHPMDNRQQNPVYQLQPLAHLSPMFAGSQTARSMPNLHAGSTGVVPPYPFAQTLSPNGFLAFPQQVQTYMSPVEMSATPAHLNPGQQPMKSQVEFSAGYVQQRRASNIPTTGRSTARHADDSHQGQQLERAELSGTPMPEVQTQKLRVVNSAETNTFAPCPTSSGGVTSGHVQPLILDRAPGNSDSATHPSQLSTTHVSSSPVELDAMSQLGQFIAELSADRIAPAPQPYVGYVNHQHPNVQQSSTVQSYSAPTYTAFTISSPGSQYTPTTPQTPQEDIPIRPLNPHTYISPAPAMPASLMPGGTNTHQRSPSNNSPQPPATAAIPIQATVPNTNLSRYTNYSTPPSSTPNSPQPLRVSTYKAYQPPPTTISLSSPTCSLYSPDSAIEPPSTFAALRDVDGASGYFRHRSDESEESCDSGKLALEYQAAMPQWDQGYGVAATT
jgi:hypothetical protein